ncbi:hypothetical protein CJJ18_10560 (plasmid) [Candidatus Williamhamiltonella defendens]|uniref:Uncharacterized protein n=1 Tax=Candidatus Williamhamiltonella defendens TaxID=138072 RepID=A0AAC9VM23_9ENTR|nr:hypothetical protein CJJ18_10560 [Candidatus Hamiltonella defensa]
MNAGLSFLSKAGEQLIIQRYSLVELNEVGPKGLRNQVNKKALWLIFVAQLTLFDRYQIG